MRQWFEDAGVPIPSAISALTGISDADVTGQRMDEHEATGIIAGSDVVIAHNAAFDAPRIEQRLPTTAGRAWACSCREVSWPEHGLDGRKLGHLLIQLGLFHQGHRAAADVWATVNLLAQSLPGGDTTGVLELVTRAGQPTLKVEACDAPFAAKDALKARLPLACRTTHMVVRDRDRGRSGRAAVACTSLLVPVTAHRDGYVV